MLGELCMVYACSVNAASAMTRCAGRMRGLSWVPLIMDRPLIRQSVEVLLGNVNLVRGEQSQNTDSFPFKE